MLSWAGPSGDASAKVELANATAKIVASESTCGLLIEVFCSRGFKADLPKPADGLRFV
jgi:hypothetical protein